jgi:S-DNA-T family DNA segregation ATPase FtsK/SpoIIIE
VVAIAGPRSWLGSSPLLDRAGPPDDAALLLAGVNGDPRPHLVLVDDAEAVDDTSGTIAALLAAGRPDVHVVVAGRPDGLRTLFGHWTQQVRRSKLGVLLRPNPDLDGDVLGATLPRRAPVAMVAGRGWLVDSGDLEVVQVARDTTGKHEGHQRT